MHLLARSPARLRVTSKQMTECGISSMHMHVETSSPQHLGPTPSPTRLTPRRRTGRVLNGEKPADLPTVTMPPVLSGATVAWPLAREQVVQNNLERLITSAS